MLSFLLLLLVLLVFFSLFDPNLWQLHIFIPKNSSQNNTLIPYYSEHVAMLAYLPVSLHHPADREEKKQRFHKTGRQGRPF